MSVETDTREMTIESLFDDFYSDKIEAIIYKDINVVFTELKEFIFNNTNNFTVQPTQFTCEVTTDLTKIDYSKNILNIEWCDFSVDGIYTLRRNEYNDQHTDVIFTDAEAELWLEGENIPDVIKEAEPCRITGSKGTVFADDYDLDEPNDLIDRYLELEDDD